MAQLGPDVQETDVGSLWLPPASMGQLANESLGVEDLFPPLGVLPRVKASMIIVSNDREDLMSLDALRDLSEIQRELEEHPGYRGDGPLPACYYIHDDQKCLRTSPTDFWIPGETPSDDYWVDVVGVNEPEPEDRFDRTFQWDQVTGQNISVALIRNDVLPSPLPSWECRDGNDFDSSCSGGWNGQRVEDYVRDAWDRYGNKTLAYRLTYYRSSAADVLSEEWDEFFMDYKPPSGSSLEIAGVTHGINDASEAEAALLEMPPSVVGLPVFMVVLYVVFVVGDRDDKLNSRVALGFCGLFGTFVSVIAGMSLCVFLGAKISVTSYIVPVIIMSIGVDDMFVLLSGLDETAPTDSIEERTAQTLRAQGMTILMTTVTDGLAFGVGMFSDLPAVSSMR